jgi:hypothetical protein
VSVRNVKLFLPSELIGGFARLGIASLRVWENMNGGGEQPIRMIIYKEAQV